MLAIFLKWMGTSLHYYSCYVLWQSVPQNQPLISFPIDLKSLVDDRIVQEFSVKVIQAYAGVPLKPMWEGLLMLLLFSVRFYCLVV